MTDVTDDRSTPPWYWRVAYRVFERRLPEEYSAWVLADVSRRGWPLRVTLTRYLNTLVVVVLILLVLRVAADRWIVPLLLFLGLLLLLMPIEYVRALRRPVTVRKEVLDRQGIDREGRPLGPNAGNRLEQIVHRVRSRLVPRREFEALLYAVAMVLVLDGTAAIGLNMRGDEPARSPIKNVKPEGCVPVPGPVRDAIVHTIPKGGATMGRSAAVEYQDELVVVATFKLAADDEKGQGLAAFFVTAEGRGYRVRISTYPDTGVKSRASKVDIGIEYNSPRVKAVIGAISCLTSTGKKK